MTQKHIYGLLAVAMGLMTLNGCYYERSGATGWAYNFYENGGFERTPYFEQETGPGLIFVEGGTFTMGQVDDDLNYAWDNIPRRTTVSSFYMDETEVTNHFWTEYLAWLQRIYGSSYPEIVERALPDTAAWRNKLAYNEPMVNFYLRHPAYRDYPVVGVGWLQANDFCKWRSDRVNEGILIREGLLLHNPDAQIDEEHFTTETYLSGQYQGEREREGLPSQRTQNSATCAWKMACSCPTTACPPRQSGSSRPRPRSGNSWVNSWQSAKRTLGMATSCETETAAPPDTEASMPTS